MQHRDLSWFLIIIIIIIPLMTMMLVMMMLLIMKMFYSDSYAVIFFYNFTRLARICLCISNSKVILFEDLFRARSSIEL